MESKSGSVNLFETLEFLLQVILACEEVLVAVDSYQAITQDLDIGFVTMMAVSPNNELIVAYTQSDTLVVLSPGCACTSISHQTVGLC